jgi:hypothetical protein
MPKGQSIYFALADDPVYNKKLHGLEPGPDRIWVLFHDGCEVTLLAVSVHKEDRSDELVESGVDTGRGEIFYGISGAFMTEYRNDLLGGVTVLNANATGVFHTAADQVVEVPLKVRAIPYYANANRGTCSMQVWMAQDRQTAKPQKQE